jgi:two-component system sensor histidine kinase CpxA
LRKIKYPLYIQTLGMLFAYLSAILIMLFVSFDAKFGFGWEALLKSPAGDRAEAISDAISLHLGACPQKEWTRVLNDFGKRYGVDFYLFDIFGRQLAGSTVTLPAPLSRHINIGLPPPPEAIRGPISIPSTDFHSFIHSFPPHFPPPPHTFKRDRFITQSNQSLWLCMPVMLAMPSALCPFPAFLSAASSNIWQNKLLFDFKFLSIALFAFLVFSVIFWWPFVVNITHKLSVLTTAAENIAQGNFTTPIKIGINDEIGRLSATVKSMADRLNGFVQGQRRLLGDISHELITPLARLEIALELFEIADTSERAGLIADIREEVKEMGLMVNELLAYAKAGLQNQQLELKPVSVRTIVEKVLLHLSDQATIENNVSQESTVLADPTLLSRAISNILRNSVRYAGNAGSITVDTIDGEQTLTIIIADNGPGVPEEVLSHLGEPFFRPEFSRNRDSGGVGLGLAIVKSCIESCGGTVRLSNRAGGGGLQTQINLQKAPSNKLAG